MGSSTSAEASGPLLALLDTYDRVPGIYVSFLRGDEVTVYQRRMKEPGPQRLVKHSITVQAKQFVPELADYYSNRKMMAASQHVLELLMVEFRNQDKQVVNVQTAREKANHKRVSSICSSRAPIMEPYSESESVKLQLVHEFHINTLEQQILNRHQRNYIFREEEIWLVICSASVALNHLYQNHFKPPFLSPKGIFYTPQETVKFAEWEFVSLIEDLNPLPAREDQGQVIYNNQSGESYRAHDRQPDYLQSYYWAPEAIKTFRTTTRLGHWRSSTAIEASSQIFGLGMTILHMCLLRPLYQSEPYSEKEIQCLLAEVIETRNKQSPISIDLIEILESMLKWNHRDRISVEDFYSQMLSRFGAFSSFKNSPLSTVRQGRSFGLVLNVDQNGTGSIEPGLGDDQCPHEESRTNLLAPLSESGVRHKKFSFTQAPIDNQCDDEDYPNQLELGAEYYTGIDLQQPDDLCLVRKKDQQIKSHPNSPGHFTYRLGNQNLFLLEQNNPSEPLAEIKLSPTSQSERESKISVSQLTAAPLIRNENEELLRSEIGTNSIPYVSHSPHSSSSYRLSSSQDDLFTDPKMLQMIRETAKELKSSQRLSSKTQRTEQQQLFVSPIKATVTHITQQNEHQEQNITQSDESFNRGRYEGSRINQRKNGFGIFEFENGGRYCGNWKDDKMNGRGTLYYSDGRIAYEGTWKDDCLHGEGILFNENPQRIEPGFDWTNFDVCDQQECWVSYEGQFHEDTKCGRGKLMLITGEYYQGQFDGDCVSGTGVFYSIKGPVEGKWLKNKLAKLSRS